MCKFQAPLPGPVWMQALEAINDKIICPQNNFIVTNKDLYQEQENCLVANVHMPDTEESNLPVLVYVHGGGYSVGWGEIMSPHTLVKSKKLVAVTFNYRLGAHGFLCLGTQGAPGNAGMKDQVALLRWVKKNIANFGGNPNDVTIAGSSAGSSAVDLLMLSDMAKGLFNKVIPESGSHLAVWSVQQDPIQNAKEFAQLKNFTNIDDMVALEDFFTSSPYDALVSETFFMDRTDTNFHFTPCVERNVGVETFLEDTPVNIIKQGKYTKLPVLYGFANLEGLMRLMQFNEWKDKMNERFADFLPANLQFKSEEEKSLVAQTVKKFYFGNRDIGEDTVQGYIDYYSDIMFTYSHLKSIQLQVESGSDAIYLYLYSFYSPPSEVNALPPYAEDIKGANHCAQSVAIYDSGFEYPDNSEEYLELKETLREMWLNFIVKG